MKTNRIAKGSIFLVLATITFLSCDLLGLNSNKYSIGHFPALPQNLTGFNTEFDDYNSDIPTFGETFPFCFSSNRNSRGTDFDIVYKLMTVEFSKKSGKLSIYENTRNNLNVYSQNENIKQALNNINTSSDEFGPCLVPVGNDFFHVGSRYRSFQKYIVLYSNNENGNQNIKLTHNTLTNSYDSIFGLDFLNSGADDFYPSLNADTTKIYWSSNRGGDFDIFSTDIDRTGNILSDLLNIGGHSITESDILNSTSDDKCPSITGNIMVFTSNREGGLGGYDLYYSRFENGGWGKPFNFGPGINTEYDEYRPIVRSNPWQFDNDMMIFSSNRPRGKGGFDLYYVGIPREGE
jgi:hypothetical protein